MNIQSTTVKKNTPPISAVDLEMDDFDFKPITSGLGFHHPKTTDIKPAFIETKTQVTREVVRPQVRESQVYQNDLSLFYGNNQPQQISELNPEIKPEKTFKKATRTQRVSAYILDLMLVLAFLGIILTAMARAMSMDLMTAWGQFPDEITPLAITLFCGFYLLYFSIFEKAGTSTLGKYLFHIKVTSTQNTSLNILTLVCRSFVSLLNFVSLGLFSYFELQDKVTQSKVIKAD